MYLPATVKIALMKSNPNKEGLCPLVLRFTQNRKSRYIYLRRYVPEFAWRNQGLEFVKERGENSIPNARDMNIFLNAIQQKALGIVLRHEQNDSIITFDQFKESLISTKSQDFYSFCEKEIEERLKSGKFSIETVKSNRFKLGKMKKFRSVLFFHEITPEFLKNYENYLRVERENGVNTIFAAMKFIRTMMNAAIRKKLTTNYPFDTYRLKFEKNTRDRLYVSEVEALQKLFDQESLPQNMQKTLKHFLFVCYTGLSWGDLATLSYEHVKDLNGVFVINKTRKKTGNEFTVPLLEEAKAMIDIPNGSGIVFPDLGSNSGANKILKDIIRTTKISKKISFHVGRHSFATVSLNKGIPREVVQKMLGHAKAEMTQLYSKVLDSYIVTEMKKWNNQPESAIDYKKTASEETLDMYSKIRLQVITNRIANGFTEAKIAEKIGLSEKIYKEMELGNREFGIVSILELSRILNFDLKASI